MISRQKSQKARVIIKKNDSYFHFHQSICYIFYKYNNKQIDQKVINKLILPADLPDHGNKV